MPRKRTTRVYWKNARAYGDFRDYADVGGRQEPLIPEGQHFATKSADTANKLVSDRLAELERLRRGVELTAETPVSLQASRPALAEYASRHLVMKRQEGTSERHLVNVQKHLARAVEYFGAGLDLGMISPRKVKAWMERLAKVPNGRGGTLGDGTRRKHLDALSDLYDRALSDEWVKSNPARDLYSKAKPTPKRKRARYWEPDQVAALIDAAMSLPPDELSTGRGRGGKVSADSYPWIGPLVATVALTGLRKSELFGLEVDDVSFTYRRIFVRPNQWRDLKNSGSERDVPLWPQLEDILRDYIAKREQSGGIGALLFPSHRHAEEKMLGDVDKVLDRVGTRSGIDAPRLHAFRHSYTAARIQTLDHGYPVPLFTVARELGHRSTAMIEERYGHLLRSPNRSEVVEFRLDAQKTPETTPA